MKLKEGFILRTVAGETVVLPTGSVTNFDMAEMVAALLAEYDVTEEKAAASVEAFVGRLKELEFLD